MGRDAGPLTPSRGTVRALGKEQEEQHGADRAHAPAHDAPGHAHGVASVDHGGRRRQAAPEGQAEQHATDLSHASAHDSPGVPCGVAGLDQAARRGAPFGGRVQRSQALQDVEHPYDQPHLQAHREPQPAPSMARVARDGGGEPAARGGGPEAARRPAAQYEASHSLDHAYAQPLASRSVALVDRAHRRGPARRRAPRAA